MLQKSGMFAVGHSHLKSWKDTPVGLMERFISWVLANAPMGIHFLRSLDASTGIFASVRAARKTETPHFRIAAAIMAWEMFRNS